MPVPGYLSTDPETPKLLPRTRPGWAPRPHGQVKLVHGWATPEEGAGQDEPLRDDWWRDTQPPAPLDPGMLVPDASRPTPVPGPVPQSTPAPQENLTEQPEPATTTPEVEASAPPPSGTAGGGMLSTPTPNRATPQAGVAKSGAAAPAAPPPQGPSSAARPQTPTQSAFVQSHLQEALRIEAETGIPHQVLLAIPGNETGWGRVMQGNNFFGIKGSNPQTGANTGPVGTWEEVGGQRVNTQDTFRAYGGYEESARDFTQFLKTNPRYAPALSYLTQNPNDWRGFIRRVHEAGYATDSQWSNKIIAIGNSIETGGDSKTNTADTSGAANRTPKNDMLGPDRQTGKTGIRSVIDVASTALGTRYQWGGAGGRSQFGETLTPTDCSGFVAWAYKRATGLNVPAYTGDIWRTTRGVGQDQAVPGDLVMFNMDSGDPHLQHVGIYIGNGQMIHDSSLNPNGGVDITPVWSGASYRRVGGIDPSQASYSSPAPQLPSGRPYPLILPPPPKGFSPMQVQKPRPAGDWQPFIPEGTAPKPGAGADREWDDDGKGPTMRKKTASYVATAKDNNCGDCSMFRRGGHCTLVIGKIAPGGSCDYFERAGKVGAGQEGFTDSGGGGALIEENEEERLRREEMERRRQLLELANQPPVPKPGEVAQRTLQEANRNLETSAARGTLAQDVAQGFGEVGGGVLGALGSVGQAALGKAGEISQGVQEAAQNLPLPQNRTNEEILHPTVPQPSAQETVSQALAPVAQAAQNVVQAAPQVPSQVYSGAQQINTEAPFGAHQDPIPAAAQATTDKITEVASDPENQRRVQIADNVIHALSPTTSLSTSLSTIYPGVQATIDYLAQNGYDPGVIGREMEKPPQPGSASEYVAKGGVITNPIDGARLMLEAWDKLNTVREEALKAAQAPEVRDTPEGWAYRQVLMIASDPTSYIGLGVGKVGRGARLLEEGGTKVAEAAEAVTRTRPGVVWGKVVTEALGRPYTEDEARHILGRAALDANDTVLDQSLSRVGPEAMKYEPLSGEQIRRSVMNAVSRTEPELKPADILRRTDQILTDAGHPTLTTEAILASAVPEAEGVVRAGLPAYQGSAQAARLLESGLRQSLDEGSRAAILARQPAAVQAHMALATAGAAAGVAHEMNTGTEDDPNHWGKAFAKGVTGFALGALSPRAAGYFNRTVTPQVLRLGNEAFAPMNLLHRDGADILRRWAGLRQAASMDGMLLESRWRTIFGDDANLELAKYIELNDALPPKYAGVKAAEDALDEWRRVTAWAKRYPEIIPDPRNFNASTLAKRFMPHVVEEQWGNALKSSGAQARAGFVSRDPFRYYTQHRMHETLEIGEAAGVKYVQDLPQILGSYYTRAQHKIVQQKLVEDLANLASRNDPSLLGLLAEDVLKGQDILKYPKGYRGINRPVDTESIRYVSRALQYFPELEDVYVSRDMARVLKNVLGEESSGLMDTGLAHLLIDTNSLFKHNVLSGIDMYHVINEVRQLYASQGMHAWKTMWETARTHTLPGAHRAWLEQPATRAAIRDAMQAGLNMTVVPDMAEHMSVKQRWLLDAMNAVAGGFVGYTGSLQAGATQEDALRNAAIGATFGAASGAPILPSAPGWKWGLGAQQRSLIEHVTNVTFSRWVPFWKLTTYQMLAPGFGKEAAAAHVNNIFGGLNMLAIGRSRNVQDAVRMSVLAPDWTESWLRTLGAAAFQWGKDAPVGEMSRRYWTSSLIQSAMTLEALNLALGHKFSWQNDPDASLLVNLSWLYDQMGWNRKDPRSGQKVTPYLDILGPVKGIMEPLLLTARAVTTAGYDALGFKPEDMPFGEQIAGAPGKNYSPDARTAWKNYIFNRTGWLPNTVQEAFSGTDWAGRPIDNENDSEAQMVLNRISLGAQNIIPAGQSDLARGIAHGDPALMTAVQSMTGMRLRRETDTTRYFKWFDQYLKEMGQSDVRWNQTSIDIRKLNQNIDKEIETIQAGLVDKRGNPVEAGQSDMTARQRTDAISAQADQRVTQRERLASLVEGMVEGPQKQLMRQKMANLEQLDPVSGENVSADIQRPDLDMNEIYRLAWERYPDEIARLKGLPHALDLQGAIGETASNWLNRGANYDATRKLNDVRSRWIVDTATDWGLDVASLQDVIKARVYQVTDNNGQFVPPPLPGVTSAELDQMVDDYQKAGRDSKGKPLTVPAEAAMQRQQYLIALASQRGLDPKALAQRIQLRQMPIADSTPAAIERRHALDVLNNARFFTYQTPDGQPMGTPKQWQDWDTELKGNKGPYTFRSDVGIYHKDGTVDERLTTLYKAQQQGRANKLKDVLNSQHKDDYYRVFGDGADFTDKQWKAYQQGTLEMWRDKPDPEEARNRNTATRVWAALTPAERDKYGIPEFGGGQPVAWRQRQPNGLFEIKRTSLAAYVRYMNLQRTGDYTLGELDPIDDIGVSSGGPSGQ